METAISLGLFSGFVLSLIYPQAKRIESNFKDF